MPAKKERAQDGYHKVGVVGEGQKEGHEVDCNAERVVVFLRNSTESLSFLVSTYWSFDSIHQPRKSGSSHRYEESSVFLRAPGSLSYCWTEPLSR